MSSLKNDEGAWPADAIGCDSAGLRERKKGLKAEEQRNELADAIFPGSVPQDKGLRSTTATQVVADAPDLPPDFEGELAAFSELAASLATPSPAKSAPLVTEPPAEKQVGPDTTSAAVPTRAPAAGGVGALKVVAAVALSIIVFVLAPAVVDYFRTGLADSSAGVDHAHWPTGLLYVILEFVGLSLIALLLARGFDKHRKAGAAACKAPAAVRQSRPAAAPPAAALHASGDADADGRVANPALMRARHSIHNAIKSGDMITATQTLADLERNGPKPDAITYNLMIRGCILKADVGNAEKYFDRMVANGLTPTLCSYNMLLDAFAKSNRMDLCAVWMKNMERDGVKGDTITYGTLMTVRARRGEKALAEGLLRQMIEQGVEPDAVCYNALVHACAVYGDSRGAERWTDEMRARGLELTVATYTALIDSCAKSGEVAKAESWLERMHQSHVEPNVISYGSLLDACARQSDPARAERWYRRMVDHGIIPNSHTFSALVTACGRAKDPKSAEVWLTRAELAGVFDTVIYSGVIDAYSKLDDGTGAERIFSRMKAAGVQPHVVAYASLIRPFSRAGDYVKVEQIIKEMEKNKVLWNEYVLFSLLLAYSIGRPKTVTRPRAEAAFRKAMADGLPTNVHVTGALARNLGRQRTHELMAELKLPPPSGK
eukprot:TRINITY_DN122809_c0_g1_i1.p1 TRINITY_DN122809_c0_g1~~TRINITY_DN122809_c0_g1_i1.p1  ORF type:complete len:661 (-),score=127.28 TRINITY_DN122809_c0_g1_i1:75-2057(-)